MLMDDPFEQNFIEDFEIEVVDNEQIRFPAYDPRWHIDRVVGLVILYYFLQIKESKFFSVAERIENPPGFEQPITICRAIAIHDHHQFFIKSIVIKLADEGLTVKFLIIIPIKINF